MTRSTEQLRERVRTLEIALQSANWEAAKADLLCLKELLVVREAQSKPADLYLCRVTRGGEELYSPCGKDYPRGRGYYTAPPAPDLPTPDAHTENNLKADGVKIVIDILRGAVKDMDRSFLTRIGRTANIEMCSRMIRSMEKIESAIRRGEHSKK